MGIVPMKDELLTNRGDRTGDFVRVIAVASGKGGVGKTNISVNLACELSLRGRNVVLMDADLGLANVDILLRCRPRATLEQVVSGEKSLDEIVCAGPQGIKIIPAASGVSRMVNLSEGEHQTIVQAFSDWQEKPDALIVDIAAGINSSAITFAKAAQELIVVVSDEPTSITDAYALIKVLATQHHIKKFRVVTNMMPDDATGFGVYQRIAEAADRHLNVNVSYLGTIPFDPNLKRAVKAQRAMVEVFPQAPASKAIKQLAEAVDKLPRPTSASGRLEFYVERLLGPAREARAVNS